MRTPKRFLEGLAAGLALSFGVFYGLLYWQLGVPTIESLWAHELNARKLARAESIRNPKLVVLAGSSALYGIKAQILEAELGMPVVNLGTHAALQPAYIFWVGRKAIRPGDTALLALEYELYDDDSTVMNKISIDYILARDPDYFRSLSLPEQFNLAMRLPLDRLGLGIKNKLRPPPPFVFDDNLPGHPKRMNEQGDMTGHTRARIPRYVPAELPEASNLAKSLMRTRGGISEIQKFIDWAKANHVNLLATFPNRCDRPSHHSPQVEAAVAQIVSFYKTNGVPVVGDFRDSLLPRSDFFDTCYHLTEEAATARSLRLAAALKPYFPAKRASSE